MDKGAKFICDRSGKAGYMRDAVVETGTGFLVLKSEVDKYPYDAVNHPQANLSKYSPKFDDPKPVKNARPDISWHAPQEFQGSGNTGGLCLALAYSNFCFNGTAASNSSCAASATGLGNYPGTGSSTGESTASAIGRGTFRVTGSSTGACTAEATGLECELATGSSTGAATTSATGIVHELWYSFEDTAPTTTDASTKITTPEGYEIAALTVDTSTSSVSRTTNNVSRGTYSWRISQTGPTDTTAFTGIYITESLTTTTIIPLTTFDFTGYTGIILDYTIVSSSGNGTTGIQFHAVDSASDSTGDFFYQAGGSASGSLEIVFADNPALDITDIYLSIEAVSTDVGGPTSSIVVDIDNLRLVV